MKLLECFVENFGALHNERYVFGDGLNCFMKENGAGKTTLACFIRAMFYGLPSYKTTTKTFDGRQHYYPFSGGKFGGNLTFENDGKIYRIERFFDKKSASRDETKVYCNNEICSTFSEDIGKKLFGLDEASFTRTVFFDSSDAEPDGRDITAKLSGDINAISGEELETAVKVLSSKRKQLLADRGKGGLIDVKKEERRRLLLEVASLEETGKELEFSYIQRNSIKEEIESLEKRLSQANDNRLEQEKWATYLRYDDDIRLCKTRLDSISADYPSGLPSAEELDFLDKSFVKYSGNKTFIENLPVENFEKDNVFENTEQSKVEHISGVMQKYREKSASNTVNGKLYGAVAAVCLLAAVAGIILLFFVLYAGIALFAAGIFGVAADAFLYLKKRTDLQSKGDSSCETEIRAFLSPLGYNGGSLEADYASFTADYTAFMSRMKSGKSMLVKRGNLISENEYLEGEIVRILSRYLPSFEDIGGAIADLTEKRRQSDGLESEISSLTKRKELYKIENNLKEYDKEETDVPNIRKSLSEKRQALAVCDGHISEQENLLEALPIKINLRERLDEEISRLAEEYENITLTEKFLSAAEKNLSERYLLPVHEKFVSYVEKFSFGADKMTVIDKNFSLSFESGGELRSEKHLSTGQLCIFGLCLRIALAECMFSSEKPFLILDDPFTGVDEKNFKEIKKILTELSDGIQILYFTCHPSREVYSA